MKSSRILSALFALALIICILTVSIGLPIYIRPFYYAHIESMGLPEYSGYTAETIRDAYDAVLDYLTLPGREFSTGQIPHSAEGAAHFVDCKVLFDLNRNLLLLSAAVLTALCFLRKAGKTGPYRLGSLAATDFDRAFVIFHKIFFPGKSNWIFDWRTDPIILVLPQDFFMHCALLIGGGLVTFSLGILIFTTVRDRKAGSASCS